MRERLRGTKSVVSNVRPVNKLNRAREMILNQFRQYFFDVRQHAAYNRGQIFVFCKKKYNREILAPVCYAEFVLTFTAIEVMTPLFLIKSGPYKIQAFKCGPQH